MYWKPLSPGMDISVVGIEFQVPISLKPTPYLIRTQDSIFYALSPLGCLRLPLSIKETVHVESTCPTNGSKINLTVTQNGVDTSETPQCVMSIATPWIESNNKISDKQVSRFFSSAKAASLWLAPYPDVTVLDIEQAWKYANDKFNEESKL